MYIGMSSGGVFESHDGGADWRPLNRGRARRLPSRSRPGVRARPALRALRRRQSRPALPAEPLRPLSGSTGRATRWTRHRRRHAQVGGLRRLSDGRPSARSGHCVGLSDGRDRRCGRACRRAASRPPTARSTAARPWQRQAVGLPEVAGVVDGQAAGDDRRSPPTVGVYFGTTSGEVWGSRDEGRTWRAWPRTCPDLRGRGAPEARDGRSLASPSPPRCGRIRTAPPRGRSTFARRRPRSATCSPRSTATTRGCASASSTRPGACGRTSSSSSTPRSSAISRRRSPRAARGDDRRARCPAVDGG